MPVDEVAACILDVCAREAVGDGEPAIHHAVAGLDNSPTVLDCWEVIRDFFSTHRVHRRPDVRYLGPPGLMFELAHTVHHRLPVGATKFGSRRMRRAGSQMLSRVSQLNTIFPYFTQRSFAFRRSHDLPADFDTRRYLATVCRGVYRFLLRRDDAQWMLSGRRHLGHGGDLAWVRQQPGTPLIRFTAWVVTKVTRKCFDSVTVDLPSFEPAKRAAAEGARLVIVPTHRSYFDFVLCSYLFFARPDLGIPIPYIAAATEFGRIPILGRILNLGQVAGTLMFADLDEEALVKIEAVLPDKERGTGAETNLFAMGFSLPDEVRAVVDRLDAAIRERRRLHIVYDALDDYPVFCLRAAEGVVVADVQLEIVLFDVAEV